MANRSVYKSNLLKVSSHTKVVKDKIVEQVQVFVKFSVFLNI
uniref:Uncharacterized protein n=1 Tax=Setaria italica TaxID=4555 RepID=K3ZG99_SETIT